MCFFVAMFLAKCLNHTGLDQTFQRHPRRLDIRFAVHSFLIQLYLLLYLLCLTDELQSGNNFNQVGMYLRSYGHDTFQQDDDPAVSLALHLHEYARYSIELTSVDTHPSPFLKVELIRIVIGDIFFVLGGNLDETLHLVIRNNEIFQTCTVLPHHELQEIVAFLEICPSPSKS